MIATVRLVRDIADVDVEDVRRYGGKATGLARMAHAGIPIPPAFAIGTDGFHQFRTEGGRISQDLMAEVLQALQTMESVAGKRFGAIDRPLLVSVRSGAAISMPGMMDTILNLGLDARSAFALAKSTGSLDFVLDTWMRFWRMFTDLVLDLDPDDLIAAVTNVLERTRSEFNEHAFEALQSTIISYIGDCGEHASSDPYAQLERTIAAIFQSWDSARARSYRQHHEIPDDLGTAVTIQAMVFGNADEKSGSGVAFTRNPNDGGKTLYGEYLIGRQGEDLVSGTHTPIDLSDPGAMEPELRNALIDHGTTLEDLYKDAVDIEFTVESGHLYLLQVRPAKRTAAAAVRIAEDLVAEGTLATSDALRRIAPDQVRKLLQPAFDRAELAAADPIAQGLGSSPGQASGQVVLDADRAAERAVTGKAVILLRPTTSPQDIRGMLSASGIVTAKGGALSHAAVVSRALDKPCIVGCDEIDIDVEGQTFRIGNRTFREGDPISIDGATGNVYAGAFPLHSAGGNADSLKHLLGWADVASQAIVWSAPRSATELKEVLASGAPGLGVIGLTDLIIASGAIDRFVALIAAVAEEMPRPGAIEGIARIVYEASSSFLADASDIPLHVRVPRVSSDRARMIIENWLELPPSLFLPLGSPRYHQPILEGLASAAKDARHGNVTVLIGGIVELAEFDRFADEVARVGSLSAGAVIQNVAALQSAQRSGPSGHWLWIDAAEILRTAYGFPSEVQQAATALDEYAAQGNIAANPFRQPAPFLMDWFTKVLESARPGQVAAVGASCTGECPTELLVALHRAGFRTFAVPTARRDETRLLLGQQNGG